MAKTKNESVRFDQDQKSFFVKKTGISSPQKIVDFLLQYWHTRNLNRTENGERMDGRPDFFDKLPKRVQNKMNEQFGMPRVIEEQITAVKKEKIVPDKKKILDDYLERKLNIKTSDDYDKWLFDIEVEDKLTEEEKNIAKR